MNLEQLENPLKPNLRRFLRKVDSRPPKPAGRLIAVGDIHGCHLEFEELLNLLNPGSGDRLILLGDLVNNGPDSHRVIRMAEEAGATALLGNHELRLLRIRMGHPGVQAKKGDRATLRQLTADDWAFLHRMRHFCHFPQEEMVFVHGGFLPGHPWRLQPASITTRIQVVDGAGRPRKRSESPGSPHWSSLWQGPPFVVYGHTPRPEAHRRPWTLGLDTGCVNGGRLTACVWPEGKIVQVAARAAYSKL